jgi:hypothetical protein
MARCRACLTQQTIALLGKPAGGLKKVEDKDKYAVLANLLIVCLSTTTQHPCLLLSPCWE